MKLSANTFDHVCVLTMSGEFTADDVEQFGRVHAEHESAAAAGTTRWAWRISLRTEASRLRSHRQKPLS